MNLNKVISLSGLVLGLLLFSGVAVLAQSSSTNYRINESQFDSGGELDASSASYRTFQSVGPLGSGTATSNSYDIVAGYITPNAEYLEMVVSNASVDFGTLSDVAYSSGAAVGGTCSCSFTVRTYTNSGYNILTASQPPTSEGGAILDAKTVLAAPSADPTVEEFGINLVDNTSPNIGANPVNQPSNSYADGQAASGYNTADQFKYGVGDVIASSAATAGTFANGQTDYTISYIAKRKILTEAGLYSLDHVLVAVATF